MDLGAAATRIEFELILTLLMVKSIRISAIPILQPIGEFYVGRIDADDLVRICTVDVRRIDNELDRYIGIQRRLNANRVTQIYDYVQTADATFPTSIIIAVPELSAKYDNKSKCLTLSETDDVPLEEVAKIIDGQHRIAGLARGLGESNFQLSISVFAGIDVATQANIFATVNLAQTKVNRSLVYDLLSYETTRSPQKSAHEIVVALDESERSPFHKRIKRLGTATPGRRHETITQAAVVDMLLPYMTSNPMKDRDRFIRSLFSGDKSFDKSKFIFRGLWVEKKDELIAEIVLNYFLAVREKWPVAWDDLKRRGNVLPKTNGLRALMRFLRPVYLSLASEQIGRVISKQEFDAVFEKVRMNDDHFSTDVFKPGTSGEARLFKILKIQLENDFQFDDFDAVLAALDPKK